MIEDEGLRAPSESHVSSGLIPMAIPEVPEESEEPQEEEPTGPDEKSEFDQRHREAFTGLLFLGALTEDLSLLGHSFKLRTPTTRERLAAGLVHKPYINTVSAAQAWTSLLVALYLEEVDGKALPEPIGPDTKTVVETRFNWVIDNINDKVIDRIFERCVELDMRIDGALNELDRLVKS